MAVLGRRLWALAGLVAAASLAASPSGAQSVTEQDVKAAFLYNFTRFVDWPEGTPKGPDPFRLCVVADPPITQIIERTMQGESVRGRSTQTVVPDSPSEARACQILFVGRNQVERGEPMLAAVRDLPVLTVADASGSLSGGGAIEFILENGRVRFDVNTETARRAGLSISSRLLQVARLVDGVPPR